MIECYSCGYNGNGCYSYIEGHGFHCWHCRYGDAELR